MDSTRGQGGAVSVDGAVDGGAGEGMETPDTVMVLRRLWSTASRNPWAFPVVVGEEQQPGDEQGDRQWRGG